MSQPLSNVLGRKLDIEQEPERGPKLATVNENNTPVRVLELRLVVALVLLAVGLVCVPVGVGLVAGTGAAIIAVGALALTLGGAIGFL